MILRLFFFPSTGKSAMDRFILKRIMSPATNCQHILWTLHGLMFEFDLQVVAAVLENYEISRPAQEPEIQDTAETHSNWGNGMLRGEGRGPVAVMRGAVTKLRSHRDNSNLKDPSSLTRCGHRPLGYVQLTCAFVTAMFSCFITGFDGFSVIPRCNCFCSN